MKTTNLLLIFFVAFLFISNSDFNESNIIYWVDHDRLFWDDFKGEPEVKLKNMAALTSSGIVYYTGCKDDKLIYKVRAYFDKSESWVKDEARNDHHLKHEQIHFDITELYARKLRKLLSTREFKCHEEKEFKIFIDAFLTNWEVEQKLYDINSAFSVKKMVQKEWEEKVESELEEYNQYQE